MNAWEALDRVAQDWHSESIEVLRDTLVAARDLVGEVDRGEDLDAGGGAIDRLRPLLAGKVAG